MLLKIDKTTPWYPKRLSGDEYMGLDSPVMNALGRRLLAVFVARIRTSLQRNFLVTNRPGSEDFPNILMT
jgi:hypothetical protein